MYSLSLESYNGLNPFILKFLMCELDHFPKSSHKYFIVNIGELVLGKCTSGQQLTSYGSYSTDS